MKIGIVGSRTFADIGFVERVVRRLLERFGDVVVVTGGARGADQLAEAVARKLCASPPEIHYPKWATHGRTAGLVRNQQIVNASDEVVALWDGYSRGTIDTVRRAIAANKPVWLYNGSIGRWMSREEVDKVASPDPRT